MQKSLQQSTGALRFTLTNDYLFHIVFQENMEILRGLLCCLLNLKHGQNYLDVMPTIHIGILDFTLFPEHPEFYAHYAMMNTQNHHIYSDKLLLNVLDLKQIHLATDDDIQCGLQKWAKLFKATTWEEIKMLAATDKTLKNVADTMRRALSDEEVRLKCEARERYERDRISLYASGHREGLKEGIEKGQLKERATIIQKLSAKGMSTSDLASLLDISSDEVESVVTK